MTRNVKTNPAYRAWRDMIRRCKDHQAYEDVTVCEAWLDFEVFEKWHNENWPGIKGFQLDKDILIPGNNVYSPEGCAFVPSALNALVTVEKPKTGGFPPGVSINGSGFKAQLRVRSKLVYLGTFRTVEQASRAYRQGKEDQVKAMAYENRHAITEEVFEALMKWSVNS